MLGKRLREKEKLMSCREENFLFLGAVSPIKS